MKPPFFPLYVKLRDHLERDPIGPIGFVRAGHCDSIHRPGLPAPFRRTRRRRHHGHRSLRSLSRSRLARPAQARADHGPPQLRPASTTSPSFKPSTNAAWPSFTPASTCSAAAMPCSAARAAMSSSTPTGGTRPRHRPLHRRPHRRTPRALHRRWIQLRNSPFLRSDPPWPPRKPRHPSRTLTRHGRLLEEARKPSASTSPAKPPTIFPNLANLLTC